ALFEALADVPLPSAKDVFELHELLVFARAYPDEEGVLASVETVLAAFESRPDLRRHRRELANSGIADTEIRYKFFYPCASPKRQLIGKQLILQINDCRLVFAMLNAIVVSFRFILLILAGQKQVALENAALRQQLAVFKRNVPRPKVNNRD